MDKIGRIEWMGPNVLDKVKYCGKSVKIFNLAKIINPQFASLDDFCQIADFAFIDAKPAFKLGKYSAIMWHCVIEGQANVTIGDRCFLGPGAKLLSSTFEYEGYYTSEYLPVGTHATRYGDIIIEDDAYIGAGTVVMPGVKIGEGAMVGANSLVNHNLKPWGIYFGNPVKLVGFREPPTEERRKIIEQLDWTKHF